MHNFALTSKRTIVSWPTTEICSNALKSSALYVSSFTVVCEIIGPTYLKYLFPALVQIIL